MAIPIEISLANAITNSVAVLFVGVVGAWIWSLLQWVWFAPKKLENRLRQQGIHVNQYRFFHGDLKEMSKMEFEAIKAPMKGFSHDYFPRIRPFLHRHLNDDAGKVFATWEGPVAMVHVADAELVKEVFAKYDEYHKPKLNPLTATLVSGVVSYDGDKWAHHRKIINPAFHMEKLKLMLPAFYTCCGETLRLWENKVDKGEHEIDVCNDLPTLSADSISRAAFGSSYEEGRRIFQLLREQILIIIKIIQSVYFPGRRYLPTETNRKIKAISKEVRALVGGIIEKRKQEKVPRDDLLGLLMDANSSHNQKTFKITTDEVIDECKLFYFAGQETTSTLLTWTMILLANHQDWQDRARQEVLQAFGTNKKPDFDGLNRLKIMNMIIQEVLRLYPPVVEVRRRVTDDNTRLGSISLPKGTLLNLSVIKVHHDSHVWGDDAKEFNPERFSKGISYASKGIVSFLAFGWGPRICVGSNFAMLEAKIALSMILQRFTFQLSPSYVHAPTAFNFLYPQFGAPIIFHRL